MAVVLMYNLATWTFMMGILKGWTFMVVLFVFITTYLANKVWSLPFMRKSLSFNILGLGQTCQDSST